MKFSDLDRKTIVPVGVSEGGAGAEKGKEGARCRNGNRADVGQVSALG